MVLEWVALLRASGLLPEIGHDLPGGFFAVLHGCDHQGRTAYDIPAGKDPWT
jgi:hypothetical protein